MDKQIIHQLHSDFERYAHTYESSGDETSGVNTGSPAICKNCSDTHSGGISNPLKR